MPPPKVNNPFSVQSISHSLQLIKMPIGNGFHRKWTQSPVVFFSTSWEIFFESRLESVKIMKLLCSLRITDNRFKDIWDSLNRRQFGIIKTSTSVQMFVFNCSFNFTKRAVRLQTINFFILHRLNFHICPGVS